MIAWFAIGIGVMAWLYVWRWCAIRLTYYVFETGRRRNTPDLMCGIFGGTLLALIAPVWAPIYGVVKGYCWLADNGKFTNFMLRRVVVDPDARKAIKS